MNYKPKRLLFSDEPFGDESFIGYILRLCQMNEIPETNWILQLAGIKRSYDYKYKYNSDFRINSEVIAGLTGVSKAKIENLLYLHEHGITRHITGNISVFEKPIPHYFIRRENPKICPLCLREKNYLRRVWEISIMTVCPIHQCLLMDGCLNCRHKIEWERKKIHLCPCGFDFRKFEISRVDSAELKLTEYIYQEFNLLPETQKIYFNYPLNTLNLEYLLKLIFFMATQCAGEFAGADISLKLNNYRLHRYLNQAIKIFDNWAVNYYKFIEWWKIQDKQYYVSRKQVYSPGNQLTEEHVEYELFNYVLHYYLDEEEFNFMHEEFITFLKRFSLSKFSK